ncbi:MAG: single-stranded-DNA-specific exonuclease RecJ [Endomicrobium sp.]|jgi:single-stranded-DNA-specific exonuclease|nr:single-stranded-DNA-specific exonuclease RecJ [Endomicrobium sp.]
MSDTEKIWKELKVDAPKVSAIVLSFPLVSKIVPLLVARGIDTVEKTAEFVYGGVEYLHSPFLFSDMSKAVERLRRALDNKETILVYGDRDVDGVTSVNIIVDTVQKLGGIIEWYVPAEEGYGLSKEVISKHALEKVKVLITVDCGISSNIEIDYANTLGIDVILTDHHETSSQGDPNAYAIINPKIANSKYPFKHVAGCVVALKLAQALTVSFSEEYNKDKILKEFYETNFDLCALGTIADSMPLTDENRIIVKKGLKLIQDSPYSRPGLGLLVEDAFNSKGIKDITAKLVSWNITPLINSPGRMHKGKLSVELLMTKDISRAKELYEEIKGLNEKRRYLQSENVEQFKQLLKEQCNLENDKALIVKASNLDHGVTGIIASQMVKTYAKPVFLFITDGKEATGAVRAIEGFDAVLALESVKDILIKYGGHSQAAGFTLEDSKSDEFIKRIYKYTEENLKQISLLNTILIESELKISDISVDFYKQLEIMQPFGIGNLRPIFCIKKVTPTEISVFGNKGEHLKFKISQKGSRNVSAVFWGNSKLAKFIQSETLLDIAFNIDLSGRNDNKIPQLYVLDIKPSY